jgi:hypothetical protein
MICNASFSPERMMAAAGQDLSGSNFSISMTPTDFRVVFQDGANEYAASAVTGDANLGLTFLQIQDLKGKVLVPLDFTSTEPQTVGEQAIVVTRLPRTYDYTTQGMVVRITGAITKPQAAYTIDRDFDLGIPVFTLAGDAAGLLTLLPGSITGDSSPDLATTIRMLSGGIDVPEFLVPAQAVAPVIAEAKTRAAAAILAAQQAPPPATTPPAAAPVAPAAPTKPAAPAK